MSLTSALLPEFDHEMSNTRQVLDRVPDDKFAWRAGPTLNTIGWVANHLAEIPSWVPGTLTGTEFDFAPPDGPRYQSPTLASRSAVVALFDANVAAARAAMAACPDAAWGQMWSLLNGGQVVFSMPRAAVIRSFVMNRTIRPRAHLIVCLRLCGVAVPGMYGPGG